ncbi:MAG: D-TA family PLP-dependent enzyme [Verrucomicrobia bacterium]|nr:D-TA family PLP-dependent enzyme [Verrucomicrobiota bacterium]
MSASASVTGPTGAWFEVRNATDVPSPALLVYPDRIETNLREMMRIAGGPARLRPHIKTHKTAELVRRQMALGITKFKCATLAEAAMAAAEGAEDLLLAYPPVGPAVEGLVRLAGEFPKTCFACLVDNDRSLQMLDTAAVRGGVRIGAVLDLDVGQHRTGIAPGEAADAVYRSVCAARALRPGGLHAYDGHLGMSDPAAREAACDAAFAPVEAMRRRLVAAGLPVPCIVAGGSPTFAIHARREGIELSPGTTVLWDAGYARKLPDLAFLPAAVLLARVISKPVSDRLCLDLGHKAVASEMPWPRVEFLNLPGAAFVAHSEEHLVVESPDTDRFEVGGEVYALPWHVCPTVALHEELVVVEDGAASARWRVAARSRRVG